MEMNEINFIHMHKSVANEVISRTTITKNINMMKLNSIVRRTVTVEAEQDEVDTPIEPRQAKSITSKPKGEKRPRSRGKKRKHDEVDETSAVPAPSPNVPDVVYVPNFCTVATQTVTEEELLTQEEEYFQREHIERVRQKLTVDFIKEEDFDSEYPQSEPGDD